MKRHRPNRYGNGPKNRTCHGGARYSCDAEQEARKAEDYLARANATDEQRAAVERAARYLGWSGRRCPDRILEAVAPDEPTWRLLAHATLCTANAERGEQLKRTNTRAA